MINILEWALPSSHIDQISSVNLDKKGKEQYHYTYVLDNGQTQNCTATCFVVEKTFKRKWIPFSKYKTFYLDIEFSEPLGDKTYYGGTIRMFSKMEKGESIEECLRRVEANTRFI